MSLPQFTLKELMEAGVHFGHRSSRWNPKMKQYIFGSRNGIHIIDLQQTVPMLYAALGVARNAAAAGGKVLFVGTKRQSQDVAMEAAERCGQFYINHRWLGGTLTNWKTVSASIKRLKTLEEQFAEPESMSHLTKKERLNLEREFNKLHRVLGGIKNMNGIPDVVVVFDANKEHIAIAEANLLGIPVISVIDTNVNPEGVDFPIPGNDDAKRALKLYAQLISDSVLDGISAQVSKGTTAKRTVSTGNNKTRKSVVKLSPKATAAAEKAETEAKEAKTEATPAAEEAATAKAATKEAPAKVATAN